MRYFNPKSLTWWSGIASISIGVAMMLWPHDQLSQIGTVLSVLSGGSDASPAGLILLGLVSIGLRDKLERV